MGEEQLERVLAEMAAVDPDRASMAESIIESLTAGEGMERIDLASVQRFAWYELPLKWIAPDDLRQHILDVSCDLFDGLDMPRYADVFRSPATAKIYAAYRESSKDGFKAFRKAHQASGVDPPDLEDFEWGDMMGIEEAVALGNAERALEEAIVTGRMTPGSRGWKTTAAQVTATALDSSHRELLGQTHRTAILTERLGSWLRSAEHHSSQLFALRSQATKRLLAPIPVPPDAAERLEPVVWMLDWVDRGVMLTQAGYLPTAMVRESWERFEWNLRWTDRAPKSESELGELGELHSLLRRVGAVRTKGNGLRLTIKGRRMGDDPEFAWRTLAVGLSDGIWPRAVAEVYTLLLLLDGEQSTDHLQDRATDILVEAGWSTEDGPPDRWAVLRAWSSTRWTLEALGGVTPTDGFIARTTGLTEFGQATLLEQIRAEATGPRSRPV
jgi:hypothetical protein